MSTCFWLHNNQKEVCLGHGIEIQVMQEPPKSEECNPGSSWNFAKQSWNPLEFGSATHVLPSSKQYNPRRV